MTDLRAGSIDRDSATITVDVSCTTVDRWDISVSIDGDIRVGTSDVFMRTGLMTPLYGIDIGLCRGSPVSWGVFMRHGSFHWSGEIRDVVYQPGPFAADAPQTRLEEFRAVGLAIQGADRPFPSGPSTGA